MTGAPTTPTLGSSTTMTSASQPIETSVQVALRIRPLASDGKGSVRGRQRQDTEVITILDHYGTAYDSSQSPPHNPQQQHQPPSQQQHSPQRISVVPLQRQFTFDHVFGPVSTQEEIYRGSAHRLVEKFLEGFNVTIMAYGQTSSGKTYTMGTAAGSSSSLNDERAQSTLGIIPRAVSELFQLAKTQPLRQQHPGYKIPAPKTVFRVSFVELYNEDLIDLLAKGDSRQPITIREDVKGNIYWTGVQEVEVTSAEEVMHLLWFGSQNRQTHSTEMNEKSSRSHAIFSIALRQERFVPTHPLPTTNSNASSTAPSPTPPPSTFSPSPSPTGDRAESPSSRIPHTKSSSSSSNGSKEASSGSASHIPSPFTSGIVPPSSKIRRQSAAIDPTLPPPPPSATPASAGGGGGALEEAIEPEGSWIVLKSKFHFVDLAGSERLKRTSAIGDRAKEGISINAGLHALGNVISALGDPSKKASHVPYRDSKLTRLLQDSLGGNALSLMIACVSPSEINLGETVNTLKYANRARNIKNASSQNQEVNLESPEYLRSVIQKLKGEIKLLREAHARNATSNSTMALDSLTPKTPASPTTASNRHSIATTSSVTTAVAGDGGAIQDEDVSNGYLRSVREDDDEEGGTGRYASNGRRGRIPSMMLPSFDSSSNISQNLHNTLASLASLNNNKSFQDFVEPVIEEYEKVISGLESHLTLTQAALNHSEQMLEEQQARLDSLEDEHRTLVQHQAQRLRETQSTPTTMTRIPVYRPQSSAGGETPGGMDHRSSSRLSLRHYSVSSTGGGSLALHNNNSNNNNNNDAAGIGFVGGLPTPSSPGFATAEYKKLEATLQRLQKDLAEAEARKADSDRYIAELELELDRERKTVITPASTTTTASPKGTAATATTPAASAAAAAAVVAAASKRISRDIQPDELDQILRKIARLEQRVQEQQEEAQEVMMQSQLDKETAVMDQANMDKAAFEQLQAERESEQQRREEDLIGKLESKAKLEQELASEKAKYGELLQQQQQAAEASLQQQGQLEEKRERRIAYLEEELRRAKVQEAKVRKELLALEEQLTKLQVEHQQAVEMGEMLHVAVADLEQRLKSTQEMESKQKAELEENLARIHALEERSLRAEQNAIQMVEEMKSKVRQEKATAETQMADELLELLEKMDHERHRVETLQAQVEQQLTELDMARAKSAEQEAQLADLEDQAEEDKAMIVALETAIARHKAMLEQKESVLAQAEARAAEFEGTLASKVELLESMEKQAAEHATLLAAKIELIQQLEQRLQQVDADKVADAEAHAEIVAKVQQDLAETVSKLKASEERALEQDQALESLREQLAEAEVKATEAKEATAKHQSESEQSILELQQRLTRVQAELDDAETRVEEAQRRHDSIDLELQALKTAEQEQVAKIQDLEVKLSEATTVSPMNSRPSSVSTPMASAAVIAAAVANGLEAPAQLTSNSSLTPSSSSPSGGPTLEESQHIIQRLEKEKARYRVLVRENEKEIQRLTVELELIADEFSTAASAFEEAEDDMKARIEELERTVNAKGLMLPANNGSSTSLLLNGVRKEFTVPSPIKAQIATLKEERDQALKSSSELSTIVADLNEKNHSLQEKLVMLQREQESIKVQHILEVQALRDRLERAESAVVASGHASARGSPVPGAGGSEDDRMGVFERILRHRASLSSTHGGDEMLATPRQSWSTTASSTLPSGGGSGSGTGGSQVRAGRHESTLVQQAKHIKQLEERLSELQNAHATAANGAGNAGAMVKDGTPPSINSNNTIKVVTTDVNTPALGGPTSRRPSQSGGTIGSPTSPFGLGITRAASDTDLSKTPLPTSRYSMEKMASPPPMRAMASFPGGSNAMVPPTPPPTIPLPSPPAHAVPATPKSAVTLAHLQLQQQQQLQHGSAPPSPRHHAILTTGDTLLPTTTATMLMMGSRPHRSASQKSLQTPLREPRERTSTSSDGSLALAAAQANQGGGNQDAAAATNTTNNSSSSTTTGSHVRTSTPPTPAALPISSTTASALEGIEVNELKSVVDTLARQVQALKVEQAMAQGKVNHLERSLQEAEAKLRQSEKGQEQVHREKEQLMRELEAAREALEALRQRSEQEKAGMQEILEREKQERARAAETRAAMEARVEEVLRRRSKFACF
ncbi:hypothetical protein DFQ27_003872 [Actinomortierella ambigua]|uniref:Kinesin motor domain-containing protein n=1 Tax=Actinomortierella ambigua TaxID=1343610 RepID=A0A9P6Q5G9_9FUNG|nr:hypothetical protein DFQ27_003872 [Actinomortierella ambigua]